MEALLEAAHYALDTQSNRWDFAIPIHQLLALGASETDLRWLVRRSWVSHGKEITVIGDDGRRFQSTGNLTFMRKTCFVLTDDGLRQTQQLRAQEKAVDASASEPKHGKIHVDNRHKPLNGNGGVYEPEKIRPLPTWDAQSRRLQFNNHLVKRFKWPAINQEAILCAFQEEGWPDRIYDPLPPQPEQDAKRRLADTIKCLNRNQANELLHFRGDGTGEGVVWERVRQCCGAAIHTALGQQSTF